MHCVNRISRRKKKSVWHWSRFFIAWKLRVCLCSCVWRTTELCVSKKKIFAKPKQNKSQSHQEQYLLSSFSSLHRQAFRFVPTIITFRFSVSLHGIRRVFDGVRVRWNINNDNNNNNHFYPVRLLPFDVYVSAPQRRLRPPQLSAIQ